MNESKATPGSKSVSEGSLTQHGESVCPIARNSSLLRELDEAESKVAELLEIAAEALDDLADVGSLNRENVDTASQRFLGLVSEVHGCLAPKAGLIRDYKPYPRSTYGPRKELELLHAKARFLRGELASIMGEWAPGSSQD